MECGRFELRTEKLKGIISKKIKNTQIIFKSQNTVGKNFFSKIKDKNKKEDISGVVYKIDCNDCSKCYIGQTSCKLKTRVSKHRSDVNTKKEFASELSAHSLKEGHTFGFNNTRILSTEINDKKRMFLEMWHIKRNIKNTINKRTDIEGLSNLYCNIMSMK